MAKNDNSILAYYQAIKDGSEIVGRWIMLLYTMVVQGLQDKLYFYDNKKANRAIQFIENFCRHHEGALAPQLIVLEPWQKALTALIFGIVDEHGVRWWREICLIIARKNGKTLYAAAVAAYCIFLDGEYGARVYFAAPKLQQASLCYDAFYQMISKEPELADLCKRRRTDIYIESTNSSASTLAMSAKKSDGFNISFCVCDEIASWAGDPGKKMYEVIKSSFGARLQPLLFSISTAGYVSDGVYDELVTRGTRVLLGASKETRLLPVFYMIDDVEKWNDINELKKSNPNLGVSISVDYMLEEIAIAEQSLSKKNEFLCKYCNIKANSTSAWLSAETIRRASCDPITLDQLRGSYCVLGIDLSQSVDLTAASIICRKNGKDYIYTQFWLPANALDAAISRDGLPYREYIQKGWLQLSGESYIDYEDVAAWVDMLVNDYEILPLKIGYDRYSSQYLVKTLKNQGYHTDDVFQGYNLHQCINELEAGLKDGTILIGDNDLLKVHLLNTALYSDGESRRNKLVKISKYAHIDGAASITDGLAVRGKYFDEIGEQLENE